MIKTYLHMWKDVEGLASQQHTARNFAPKVLYLYGKTGKGKEF